MSKIKTTKIIFCLSYLLFIAFLFSLYFFNVYIQNQEMKNDGEINYYCTIDNVFRKSIIGYNRITLILHSPSSNNILGSIKNQINIWNGPISLAIVFQANDPYENIECITKAIHDLHENPSVAAKLSVHYLLMNKAMCFKTKKLLKNSWHNLPNQSCHFSDSRNNLNLDEIIKYPSNIAKNFARKLAETKYVFISDMEIYFSKGFEKKMLVLAETILNYDPKTVLICRSFEIENEVIRMKETKEGLINLIRKNKARELRGNLTIPGLKKWINTNDGINETSVQFYMPYNKSLSEPYFVAVANVPSHNENFLHPYFDDVEILWHMCRADYKFAIVSSDVFVYKKVTNPERHNIYDLAKNELKIETEKALGKFKRKLSKEYPTTEKDCPNL